jgi:hypothetical protein
VQDEVLLLRQLLVGADHAETIEINGWSSGILDILLKVPDLENSPFKG